MSHPRAGTVALPEDLTDIDALINAYYHLRPDVAVPAQRVAFGTSGPRGSSLDSAFNEDHIAATTRPFATIARRRESAAGCSWDVTPMH